MNENLFSQISNRQIFQTNLFSPNYYRNQIMNTLFDKKKLFHSNIYENATWNFDVKFSYDDKYMFSTHQLGLIKIWDVENNLNNILHQSNRYLHMFVYIIPCRDTSKIYIKDIFYINIIDLNTSKVLNTFMVPSKYHSNVLLNVKNFNVATYTRLSKLFTIDFRDNKHHEIKGCEFIENISCLDSHPFKEYLILVASKENGLYTLDMRNYKPDFFYNLKCEDKLHKVVAKYNKIGDHIFLISYYSCPLLYNINKFNPVIEFKHINYSGKTDYSLMNSFMGFNEDYVLAGSSDFNYYMWEIPKKKKLLDYEIKSKTKIVDTVKTIFKGNGKYNYGRLSYNFRNSILAVVQNDGIKTWSTYSLNEKPKIQTNFLF